MNIPFIKRLRKGFLSKHGQTERHQTKRETSKQITVLKQNKNTVTHSKTPGSD